MSNSNLTDAFNRGMLKRAEELGLDKQAFLGALVPMGVELGSSLLGYGAARTGVGALAGQAGRRGLLGWLGRRARGLVNTAGMGATNPYKAMAADQAMFMMGQPVARKISGTLNPEA
jgi:hypothetical protein